MHVKILGYPIGCQPEISNEDYQSLRFFNWQKSLNCLKKDPDN